MLARQIAAMAVLTIGMAVIGCGPSGPKQHRVYGTVQWNGGPVPKGLIFFDPDAKGTQGFANIVNGKFDSAQQGQGVEGGRYTIRISGFDGKEGNEAPFGQPLFPEYTEQRELPQSDTEITFDLKGQKK